MSQLDINNFLEKHQLDGAFIAQTQEYFAPLAREIVHLHQNKQKTIVLGINGAQGSGKSTLAALLVEIFSQKYGLYAVNLSLDDFYYQIHERKHLAATIHPLLATRGVPGTHDIMLANDTLDALLHHDNSKTVYIPRFNKATDDRHDHTQWTPVHQAPAIIIFEGWCVGACAQSNEELARPINSLERNEDSEGVWRNYVNQQLLHSYEPLFHRFDCTIMLKAPGFQCVYEWRLEQEQKLIESLQDTTKANTMSPTEIQRFIQHYQRITEHVLKTLPETAEYVFVLDSHRHIEKRLHKAGVNPLSFNTLVFTDLDGSLLDHHSYSYVAANSTLDYLEQNAIPVIPCSSKTQDEIEKLRSELNNSHPFIIENGAAIFIPKHYFKTQPSDTYEKGNYWIKEFVKPHEFWLSKLNEVRDDFMGLYKPFSEMTIEEISQITDLSLEQAALASKRQFGEPILWLGDEKQKLNFIKAIKTTGAHVLQGGRFLHICGDANKGNALIWLANIFQSLHNKSITSIAIGDSHNDIQMLDMSDIALIIRSPVHGIPSLSRVDDIYISDDFGPVGWSQGIQQILDDLTDHYLSPATGELHG